jgi:hypothetical protein
MSDYQSDGWTENPFTFSISRQVPNIEGSPVPIQKILRDLFDKIKAKFMRMPPAKILPVEPVATTQWSPEMGMSQTLADRFAPNPAFIGLPLRRKDIETTQGTKGFNTHYNIMIDQSGSMSWTAYHDPETGVSLHRGLVCRLATACLISQASLNLDSFTVFSYNDTGKILWPLPDGGPSFEYEPAIDFLTSDGVATIHNAITGQGQLGGYWNNDTNLLLNALDAAAPDGENNEASAFEIMIDTTKRHGITGMITVFITDGANLAGPLKEYSSVSENKPFDEWMRQYGHLFYIIVGSDGDESSMSRLCKNTIDSMVSIYNYPREIAEKFVWMFPDRRMTDPETGEAMTDIMDQMGWLFTEIGKIFAGTSEYFDDVVEYFGAIEDGAYDSSLSSTED